MRAQPAQDEKDWLTKWPVKIAAGMVPMSTEIIMIPIVFKGILALEGLWLTLVTASWATGEIIYWYWFSGWVLREIARTKTIQQGRTIGEDALAEAKKMNIRFRAEAWVRHHVIDPFTPGRYEQASLVVFLRESGLLISLLTMFGLGFVPLPLVWITGLCICRLISWRGGFAALAAGNALKNIVYALLWERFWVYRAKIGAVLLILGAIMVLRYTAQVIKNRKN